MPSRVEFPASSALSRRLNELKEMARPGSRVVAAARAEIKKIVEADHREKLMRGVDRYGRPLAPLAESTRARRKGNGPILIPRGMASRLITGFRCEWVSVGTDQVLRAFVVGAEWVRYHFTGTRKMLRRDVSGVSPKAWAAIVARMRRVPDELRRYRGGR
jgi:hypothetical protein